MVATLDTAECAQCTVDSPEGKPCSVGAGQTALVHASMHQRLGTLWSTGTRWGLNGLRRHVEGGGGGPNYLMSSKCGMPDCVDSINGRGQSDHCGCKGSFNVSTAAMDIIHCLLAFSRPTPSWPWPYPSLKAGLGRLVPWVGSRAHVTVVITSGAKKKRLPPQTVFARPNWGACYCFPGMCCGT